MKFLKAIFVLITLFLFPTIVSAVEKVTLTCPNSGDGTPPIELTLTAKGGFELPKDQTMFLPLQFDQAKMENGDSQQRVKLSCLYNSFSDKRTEQKTVILVAFTPPGVTKCNTKSSTEDGKLNQLVCEVAQ